MYDLLLWMSDYCSMILSVLVPALSGGTSVVFLFSLRFFLCCWVELLIGSCLWEAEYDLLSKAISFCSTPSVFCGAAEENLHKFLSFVASVSLSLSQKTLSEHSFSNSSWPVLRRNCFSVTHFLLQVAVCKRSSLDLYQDKWFCYPFPLVVCCYQSAI